VRDPDIQIEEADIFERVRDGKFKKELTETHNDLRQSSGEELRMTWQSIKGGGAIRLRRILAGAVKVERNRLNDVSKRKKENVSSEKS
jgi:hypothetical protein